MDVKERKVVQKRKVVKGRKDCIEKKGFKRQKCCIKKKSCKILAFFEEKLNLKILNRLFKVLTPILQKIVTVEVVVRAQSHLL